MPTEAQLTFTNLHSFSILTNGASPRAPLVLGNDGNLYGTTYNGGANGGYGTVFKVTTNGVLTVLYKFTGQADGANPQASLVLGTNGSFYGTASSGGTGVGTVFSITTNGTLTNLHSFQGNDGSLPEGALVQGGDGSFYGTTSSGGTNGYGTVFKITTNGTLTSLHSFNRTNGANPMAALVLGSNGSFYGTTSSGGTNGYGTVFSITTNGTLTSLHSFNYSDGANSMAALVLGSNGSFYGTTSSGGTNGYGTVFSITTNGTLTSLHSFNYSDGAFPQASLVLGTNGSFYGTTPSGTGNGTIFSITTNGTLTSLYSFNRINGANPMAALVLDSNGSFYGTTDSGGANGSGAIFKITSSGLFTELSGFPGLNDGQSANAMIHCSDGNFYGTTQDGGSNGGVGNVFKITTNGILISLYSFSGGADGSIPLATLVQYSDGNLYGTTSSGGAYMSGTIFKITTNGTLTTLYSFTDGYDGSTPNSVLVQGWDGNLYGTTSSDGIDGNGGVFKISTGGDFTPLYLFTNGVDGAYPNSLILGNDGNFYGTASQGGIPNDSGTVFKITTNGALTSLYAFTGTNDGGNPLTSLVQGINGNFYGTTSSGGTNAGNGTVFEITPEGLLTTLYSFNGQIDGDSPNNLLAGTDGKLYGTTSDGGTNSTGGVFAINANGTLTNLYSFTGGNDGGSLSTGLTQDSDGSLYGTTPSGGAGGYGDVFRLSGNSLPSPLPVLTVQPTNPPATVTGLPATFSVDAFGDPPLSYQWNLNGVPLSNGGEFAGVYLSVLRVNPASSADAGTYTVTVSNSSGVITSSNAVLTLIGASNAMEYFSAGTNYLAFGNFAAASLSFSNALNFSSTNATYKFFYAVAQLLSLPQQPAGSNFLTHIGIGSAGRDVYNWQATEPTNANGRLSVPVTTPPLNAEEFVAQLRTNVLPAIVAAQSSLAQITDTNFTVNLTASETHASSVTLDWGDLQVLQSICQAAELLIYTTYSWNLDVQLNTASNYFGKNGSFQAFLTNYPSALTVATTNDLPAAQGSFTNAISEYFTASQFIRSRPPNQIRLFNLDPGQETNEFRFRETLTNLLASLNGPVVLTTAPSYTVSAAALFSGNFAPRSFLPQFDGGDFVWESFPDTTFDGLFTGLSELQLSKGLVQGNPSVLHLRDQAVLNEPGISLSVLYNFTNRAGATGVVQGPDGSLYGTLAYGGRYVNLDPYGFGFGSIFKITPAGQFSILYSFGTAFSISNQIPLDGANPNALILANDGKLYGTTQAGGTNDAGAIFVITTNGLFTNLYSFYSAADHYASSPAAALVQAANGTLYGTSEFGGTNNGGTIFALSTNGVFTFLDVFPSTESYSYPFGAYPMSALVEGSDGNLYGTTSEGGIVGTNIGYGTLFMVALPSGQISLMHVFGSTQDVYGDPLDGAVPNGLLPGGDGYLYGTTLNGGSNYVYSYGDGTLFRILPGNPASFQTLHSFDQNFGDGYYPSGSLVEGTGGAFYGVSEGGANQRGTIFGFTATTPPNTLAWFTTASGSGPNLLTLGLDGHAYGVTGSDGSNGDGTVYQLNVTSLPPQIQIFTGSTLIVNQQSAPINFGSVVPNGLGPILTFTVSNLGGQTLNLGTPTVPPGYTLISNPSATIAPASSGTFSIQLNSTSTGGLQTGSVSFSDNDPINSGFSFPVTGLISEGKTISLNGNLAFGGVPLNSSASLSFTISNNGNATLTITGITYANGFSGAWAGTLAPGDIQTVPVTFEPTSANAYFGKVTVNSDATGGVNFIPVSGYGESGDLTLVLGTNGQGKVTPEINGKTFPVGSRHVLTAIPDTGWVFSNWSGTFPTNKNPLDFTMESSTVIEANFIPNPFLSVKGTFNGLFFLTNGVVTEETAGMLKGLVVSEKGAYSGVLLVNGASHGVSGTFNLALQASNQVRRADAQGGSLTLAMAVSTSTNAAPQLTGSVSGTTNGVIWSSALTAYFATNTLPSAEYTMLILPDTNNAPPVSSPGGDGYALITNYSGAARNPASATARVTGALADGTPFNETIPVSQTGFIPLYANLYANQGLMLGWINLDLTNTNATASTGLTWIHPQRPSGLYKNGFTNIILTNQIQLSFWTNSSSEITKFKELLVSDVIETNAQTNAVSVSGTGQISGTSITGSINPKTGLLKVVSGTGDSRVTGAGAILLNATNGGGYSLTKTNARAVQLSP